MVEKNIDILIVGGGLIGTALSSALSSSKFKTLLIDAKPTHLTDTDTFDARSLALSPASIRILKMLQVWPSLAEYATAIKTIHISEQGKFGRTLLKSEDSSPLGVVVEMQHLSQAIEQSVDKSTTLSARLTAFDATNNIATIQTANTEMRVQARIVVAADGANSILRQLCALPVKEHDYAQDAIVANIGLTKSHEGRAFERFTSSGPLALLPMTGCRAALVWSLPRDAAARLQKASDTQFLNTLQQAFGYRLGRLVKVGLRTTFPLQQIIMPTQTCQSIVFIGNAAHTLHPVAGQGFNLSLRDIATLAQCLTEEGLHAQTLQHYQKLRTHDQAAMTYFTHGLIKIFSPQFACASMARGLGLLMLEHSTLLQKCLLHYARGFGGITPDLACGIPLAGEI